MAGTLTLLICTCALVKVYSLEPNISGNGITNKYFSDRCTWESDLALTCECNNSYVPVILSHLPLEIRNLTLTLTNYWNGEISLETTIDLRLISQFVALEYFILRSSERDVTQHFTHQLLFDDVTFLNLTNLQEVQISVATNRTFNSMVTHLEKLKVLDLSHTERLVFHDVVDMLNSLNTTALKVLLLCNFQTIGLEGFSSQLNISTVFKSGNLLLLEELDLSKNTLGVIYPSLIDRLPKLRKLDLSYNYLITDNNDPLLLELLLHPILEVLAMNDEGTGSYPRETKYDLTQQKVDVSSNEGGQVLSKEPGTTLRMVLTCINTIDSGNISTLLNNTELFCMVLRCATSLLYPHLLIGMSCNAFIALKDNLDFSCPYLVRFPFLQKMKEMRMDNLNWYTMYSFNFHKRLCITENSLRNISFTNNGQWIDIFHLADNINLTTAGFQHIKSANLSSNNLNIQLKEYYPKLQKLDLSYNKITFQNKSVCTGWPAMKTLMLTSTAITKTHTSWFDSCYSLEYLDLRHNLINLTESGFSIRESLYLRKLLLDSNNIGVLPKSFTDQLDQIIENQQKKRLSFKLELTFGRNPLECSCTEDAMHTIAWFQNTDVNISNKESYSCTGAQGQMLLSHINIEKFKHSCFPSNTVIIIETSFSILGILLLTAGILLLHRYRWRVTYQFWKLSNCLCQCKQDQIGNANDDIGANIKYDAFVSYCADDRFWVHDCLMKTLESDKYGLKLCIHYRDFRIGEDISSEIVQSIHQSRKLIIVLSETSMGRPWCQFELQQALSVALKRRMKLAIIKLGSLINSIDDITVASILDNNVILDWHESRDAQKVFWVKLLAYMYDNMDTCTCFCCKMGKQSVGIHQVNAFAQNNSETRPLLLNENV